MITQGLNTRGGMVAHGLNPRLLRRFVEVTSILLSIAVSDTTVLEASLNDWANIALSVADAVRADAISAADVRVALAAPAGGSIDAVLERGQALAAATGDVHQLEAVEAAAATLRATIDEDIT